MSRPARARPRAPQVTTELRSLAGSRHPHVVAYRQSYLANGAVTILMEHMDAGSLADLLARVRTSRPRAGLRRGYAGLPRMAAGRSVHAFTNGALLVRTGSGAGAGSLELYEPAAAAQPPCGPPRARAQVPRLPERLLVEVTRQVVSGLAYLHAQLRIVHR